MDHTQKQVSNKTHQINPHDLLDDPNIVTVTVNQAALILGIAKSTAHKAYKKTGFLLGDQVPVLVCGSRTIVSIADLRAALNYPQPTRPFAYAPSDVSDAINARRLAQ